MLGQLFDIFYRKEQELESSKTGTGWSQWGLAIAKVMFVDYEAHTVTLQGIVGSVGPEFKDTVPIPITYAGGGLRSFLGLMPSIGDFCVVGWISSNSSGQASARKPIILNWYPPPPGMARDWYSAQEYEHGEGMDTYGVRKLVEGISERTRFKMRHMEPGNVVASSAQGADLVLDESVRLANRRGNEILLRDQDQSLVTRSIAYHAATSGTRLHVGPIQRDANILPVEMVSDGNNWEHMDLSNYLDKMSSETWDSAYGLIEDGLLHPALPFRLFEDDGDSLFEMAGHSYLVDIDPFSFLEDAGFLDETGRVNNLRTEGFSYYGGKSFFRFSMVQPVEAPVTTFFDAASNPKYGLYPEFRVEVEQTSDGTLPVTEQTDGFDADRLPEVEEMATLPLAEFVLGTVVGNNVYGEPDLYGHPIAARLDGPLGLLESGYNKPIGDHAATLLKVNPAVAGKSSTWVAIRKDGKVIASLANGLEVFVKNGYKFATASPLILNSSEETTLSAGGEVTVKSLLKNVSIVGARPTAEGEGMNLESGADQAKDSPAVKIESLKGNISLKSAQNMDFQTQSQWRFRDGKGFVVEATDAVKIDGTTKMSLSAETYQEFSSKTCNRQHDGGSALDGPCLKVTIPGTKGEAPQLVQDEYLLMKGSRKVTHTMGDYLEIMGQGQKTEILTVGTHTSMVGPNSVVHSAGAHTTTQTSGSIVQTAPTGFVSQTGQSGIVATTSGLHTVVATGGAVISAPANAAAAGFAITSGSLCPVSGRPLVVCTNYAAGTLIV